MLFLEKLIIVLYAGAQWYVLMLESGKKISKFVNMIKFDANRNKLNYGTYFSHNSSQIKKKKNVCHTISDA